MEFLNLLGITTVSDIVVVIIVIFFAFFFLGFVLGSISNPDKIEEKRPEPPTLVRKR